jgi:uncharacterized hydrophobic protein (TIGR00341 family)
MKRRGPTSAAGDDVETRLIELVAATDGMEELQQLLREHGAFDVWSHAVPDMRVAVRAVVPADRVDDLMTEIETRVSTNRVFRALLIPVHATLPRPPEPEQEKDTAKVEIPEATQPAARHVFGTLKISREELYTQISGSARLTPVYLVTIALSTLVAIVGLERNNVAIIIGAMVIAPLLGPNVALALATTLGDLGLGRAAARTALVGIGFTIAISALAGLVLVIDPASREIASRTSVGVGDIILALASGAAGALSFTTGVEATLIGVMVAVALLPPTVTFGLLLGDSQFAGAMGAGLLFLVNLVSINLAAVAVFLLQGIRPTRWWEAEQARRASWRALLLWGLFLAVLSVAIWLAHRPPVLR